MATPTTDASAINVDELKKKVPESPISDHYGNYLTMVTTKETELKQIVAEGTTGFKKYRLELPFPLRFSMLWTCVVLILVDLSSLITAGFLSISLQTLLLPQVALDYYQIVPFIILCILAYGIFGLYPAFGISPVDELRKLTISSSIVILVMSIVTIWLSNPRGYSYLYLTLTWLIGLVLVPLGRPLMRMINAHLGFFGEPIVVVGYGLLGKEVIRYLLDNLMIGLIPVAIIDVFEGTNYRTKEGIPVFRLDKPENLHNFSKEIGIKTGIMILSELPPKLLNAASMIEEGGFRRMIFIPDKQELSNLGIKHFDLRSYFGLEVKWGLTNAWARSIKRIMDILLVIMGGFIIFPLLLMIAGLVKLDSKGNVFYGQMRIGKGRRKFKAWKFRTMVPNAEQVLNDYLNNNAEMRFEWEATHKLRNDPRVTRVGRILRKLSLDELPQIWNVLKGEMSLIGPRPIVDDEVKFYRGQIDLYSFVRPGITGLWQVSGRNDTSYDRRIQLDTFYVHNWSIWFDIYILALTVKAVLTHKGAY